MTSKATTPAEPAMTEGERVQRFESAYNRIDHALSDLLKRKGGTERLPFSGKLRMAGNRFRRFRKYLDFLHDIGELRNAIVHNRTEPNTYLAAPNEETVQRLEHIEKRLFSPERVTPKFQKEVIVLQADQSLAEAWELLRTDGYSRYPVYDGEQFIGLLTANGFARWCAARVENNYLNIDTTKVTVREILDADHRRTNVLFIARKAYVDDADELFQRTPKLEAILITEHGKEHETPLGMICAADVAAIED